MRILLVGINAKYIHSNLAIRLLEKYVQNSCSEILIEEFTINQSLGYILSEVYKHSCDIICFSCYIWNIEYVKKTIKAYKKIRPEVQILLGGPEVSYDGEKMMSLHKEIDYIISGEGEGTFKELLNALDHKDSLCNIEGLIYKEQDAIKKNQTRSPLSMDELPFIYEDGFELFDNRIIYYETMRGCPFNCQYCLSSIEKGVRFRSLELVKRELKHFLDHKVKQVKLVDRTFNCNKEHALNIWRYINENDNGLTNFHFEISADLLDEETLLFLNSVREGLFQFEIGVQSTHLPTLDIIKRRTEFDVLAKKIEGLKRGNNIHLHLDLIIGLPRESFDNFKKSFNDVYSLQPEQLQLGFLKILKGSGMEQMCETYGIKHHEEAPYEILCTDSLSYAELQKLKVIEEMVELFYNSNQYANTIAYLECFFEQSFDLYEDLARFFTTNNYHKISHSKTTVSTIIKEFGETIQQANRDFLNDVIKLDLCLQEKIKRYPEWLHTTSKYKESIVDFYREKGNILSHLPELIQYDSKQISRMAHIEVFDYDMTKWMDVVQRKIDKKECAILFNYHCRDKMRHNASVKKVNIV